MIGSVRAVLAFAVFAGDKSTLVSRKRHGVKMDQASPDSPVAAGFDSDVDSGSVPVPKPMLIRFLRVTGWFTVLALGAALMPAKWFVEATEELGLGEFPQTPLVYYLARHLSLMYGFVGLALLWFCRQFSQPGPVSWAAQVRPLGVFVIAFGVARTLIDVIAGMPLWWTAVESGGMLLGGCAILVLQRRMN